MNLLCVLILSVELGELALNCGALGEVILSVKPHGEVILSVGPGEIALIATLMVKLFYLQAQVRSHSADEVG